MVMTTEAIKRDRRVRRLVRLLPTEYHEREDAWQQVRHWVDHGFRGAWIIDRVKRDLTRVRRVILR